MEHGLIEAWKRKYWPTRTACSEVSWTSTLYKPITLEQTTGAFIVCGIGILIAVILLILEQCSNGVIDC